MNAFITVANGVYAVRTILALRRVRPVHGKCYIMMLDCKDTKYDRVWLTDAEGGAVALALGVDVPNAPEPRISRSKDEWGDQK
jgi:hypothetical protein